MPFWYPPNPQNRAILAIFNLFLLSPQFFSICLPNFFYQNFVSTFFNFYSSIFSYFSAHYFDQMSEGSKVSKVTICVEILKWQSLTDWLTQWPRSDIGLPGQLKTRKKAQLHGTRKILEWNFFWMASLQLLSSFFESFLLIVKTKNSQHQNWKCF